MLICPLILAQSNKRLRRTGISVPLIDNLRTMHLSPRS